MPLPLPAMSCDVHGGNRRTFGKGGPGNCTECAVGVDPSGIAGHYEVYACCEECAAESMMASPQHLAGAFWTHHKHWEFYTVIFIAF